MTDDADDSRRAAFTPRGYAASVRDLQRALGKAGPPSARRRLSRSTGFGGTAGSFSALPSSRREQASF
jgi:hypothetical protein